MVMAGVDEEGGIRLAREERAMRQTALCVVLRALNFIGKGEPSKGCNGRSVCLGRSYWIYCGLLEWGK